MTTRRSALRVSTRIAALATAATLALTGCASAGSPAGTSEPTSLTWGWALPTSWDPVTSTAGWDTHALALVYDGLTQLDIDGEVVPASPRSGSTARTARPSPSPSATRSSPTARR